MRIFGQRSEAPGPTYWTARRLHARAGNFRLGIESDEDALTRYGVDYTFVEPPRHVYRYVRPTGEVTYYGCSKQELHRIYPDDAQPICEPGATLEVIADDGTDGFAQIFAAVHGGRSTLRRKEPVALTA